MTLNHLFLVHPYKIWAVHYVSPTDDTRYQAQKMKTHGLFSDVHDEVGHVIVADVSAEGVPALLAPDRDRLNALIQRKYPICAGRRPRANRGNDHGLTGPTAKAATERRVTHQILPSPSSNRTR
jgi:hypothetical protein